MTVDCFSVGVCVPCLVTNSSDTKVKTALFLITLTTHGERKWHRNHADISCQSKKLRNPWPGSSFLSSYQIANQFMRSADLLFSYRYIFSIDFLLFQQGLLLGAKCQWGFFLKQASFRQRAK